MTVSSLERRLRALEAWVQALAAWRDARTAELTGWTFGAPGQAEVTLSPGEPWPLDHTQLQDQPVTFRRVERVPDDLAGPLELLLDLGGEGLVRVQSGGERLYQGGLNPYHRRFPLGVREAGDVLDISVEVVPRGLFGSPTPRPHLETARLCLPQPEVVQLHAALHSTAAAARALGVGEPGDGAAPEADREVVVRLLNLAEHVLKALDWPSGADGFLSRLGLLGGGESFTSGLWSVPRDLPHPQPLSPEVLGRVVAADEALRTGLKRLAALFPPRGLLALSGHAHLDLGWLWPVHETRRKGQRTLSTVAELMDRYPDFTFNQSSAQLYAWMEEQDPALFARLTERVREGRLEPVGGMWVEPDGQMSGGEALARHLLYGQGYFQQRFGQRSTVAWLPDTFGFTPGLPQLLRSAGVTGFFTTKLNWNEQTRFPHELFHWEGLDGSRVLTHTLYNPGRGPSGIGGYNGDVQPDHLLRSWRAYGGKTLPAWGEGPAESVFTFGFGDGGGGPTPEMLNAYDVLREFPALPRLHMTRIDELFARLPQENLPVWAGELYLELHRGTLTSQAEVKRKNRQAEHRLLEAEVFAALGHEGRGGGDQQAELERLWKVTLLNQFHDILPGSSIREVYETALPELDGVARGARAVLETVLANGQTAREGVWTVLNAASWDRPLSVVVPGAPEGLVLEDGTPLPAQPVEGGLLVHAPEVMVPAFGTLRLRADSETSAIPGVSARAQDGGALLENARLRAELDAQGVLVSLRDLTTGEELLGPGGHRLLSFPDLPYAWEAWDVARGLDAPGDLPLGEPVGGEVMISVQDGPLEASVTVRRAWRESAVVQTFTLRADSPRLDVRVSLDWHERRTLLRAVTNVNAHARDAWFETVLGAQARATHRNTPFDEARFEVSAHRWADVSQPGRGLSLLNDGRYGHSVLGRGQEGTELALSLIRGPMWPDPQADLGAHELTYALYPHAGDWRSAHTTRQGFDLNSPLMILPGERDAAPAPELGGLPLMLSALKRAEDGRGLILRVYEPHGQSGRATVTLPGLSRAGRVNTLEDADGPLDVQQDRVTLDVRPFELISLRLERRA